MQRNAPSRRRGGTSRNGSMADGTDGRFPAVVARRPMRSRAPAKRTDGIASVSYLLSCIAQAGPHPSSRPDGSCRFKVPSSLARLCSAACSKLPRAPGTPRSDAGGLHGYLRTFGEVIRAWPAMVSAAGELGLLEALVAGANRPVATPTGRAV
jgi:hypothetical protein